MTDKTDIPELRRFNFEIWPHEAYISEQYDGEYVLFADANQQFEAERQRAGTRIAELEKRLRYTEETLIAAKDLLTAAEKERDALKSAHSNMVTRCALLRQRTDLPVDRIPAYNSLVKAQDENAALKAKLANPVVLPAGYAARAGHPFHEGERNVMIPNKHGDWLSRFEVEHAIHVAGFPFTVKGE